LPDSIQGTTGHTLLRYRCPLHFDQMILQPRTTTVCQIQHEPSLEASDWKEKGARLEKISGLIMAIKEVNF